jgi:hypothetical protein
MKLELYKVAVLARDLPGHRLKRGGIVKPVEHHLAPEGTEGYSAEVLNALGDTLAVIAVANSALESLREGEVLCARMTSFGTPAMPRMRNWPIVASTRLEPFPPGLSSSPPHFFIAHHTLRPIITLAEYASEAT